MVTTIDSLGSVRRLRIMDVDRFVFGRRRRVGQGQLAKANHVGDLLAGVSQNKEFVAIGEKLRIGAERDRPGSGRKNPSDNAHCS